MAGLQFMREAQRWEAKIIPVDSEPSAIFQCVQGSRNAIRKVFLTASGGAFYKRRGSLRQVGVAEALKHPTWKMGRKITIDCATLMNKGFESIEIVNLFGLKPDQIEIVIHPQSIIHSAVEFVDGSVIAQLSLPDMRLPIQYALTYPRRVASRIKPLDLFSIKNLTFDKPDFRRFPCLELAREALACGGGMPAVLSAADEVAVEAFIDGRLNFTDIPRLIEKTMRAYHGGSKPPGFSEVVEIDAWARSRAKELCQRL